ncbi:hypothetical protein ACQZV8_16445, partial [Magnetococcales bacterium HHB-1]
ASFDTGVVRDYNYFNWRYLSHPFSGEYLFFTQRSNEGSLIGLGVLQKKGEIISIADLILDPEDKGLALIMLRNACFLGRQVGGGMIVAKSTHPSLESEWLESGLKCAIKPYRQFLVFSGKQPISTRGSLAYGEYKIY